MKAVESRREQNSSPSQNMENYSSAKLQHSVKLASQVKSQLSLLEDLQNRRIFILNDVSGIVKRN